MTTCVVRSQVKSGASQAPSGGRPPRSGGLRSKRPGEGAEWIETKNKGGLIPAQRIDMINTAENEGNLYQFWPIRNNEDIEHIKDVLNGDIHLTDWRELNDTLEGVYKIQGNGGQEVGQKTYQAKKHFMVACFAKPWMKGGKESLLRNHVMWTHYASKHTGVAIELKVIKAGLESLQDSVVLKPVKYGGNKLKPITVKDLEDADNDPSGKGSRDMAVKLLSTKLSQWEYEQEVRLLVDLTHENDSSVICRNGHKFFHNGKVIAPCHMYLGSRFLRGGKVSPCVLAELLAKCANVGIGVSNVADKHRDIFMTLSDYESLDAMDGTMGKGPVNVFPNCDCALAGAIKELYHQGVKVESSGKWGDIVKDKLSQCQAFQKVRK